MRSTSTRSRRGLTRRRSAVLVFFFLPCRVLVVACLLFGVATTLGFAACPTIRRRQGTLRLWGRDYDATNGNGAASAQEMFSETGDFDIRTSWKEFQEEGQDFWKNLVVVDNDDKSPKVSSSRQEGTTTDENNGDDSAIPSWMTRIGDTLQSLLEGTADSLEPLLSNLVRDDDDDDDDDASDDGILDAPQRTLLPQVLWALTEYHGDIQKVLDRYLGDLDFSKLNPTALWYFTEWQEEVKQNASYKRRQHRFLPNLGVARHGGTRRQEQEVQQLYDMMVLAGIAYRDSVQDIAQGLAQVGAKLLYAQCDSWPARPSHVIAIPTRQQSSSSEDDDNDKDVLQLWLIIRGTKTLTDAVTDLCADTVPYGDNDGLAHAFMLKSGQYLVEKHYDWWMQLLQQSGRSQLQLTIVGHSLGAGTAAFCALEIQQRCRPDVVNVQVYGFGTPSVVSAEIAQDLASCMTTVICDADVVPRLNGITLANTLVDVMSFDYRDRVDRDLDMALQQLEQQHHNHQDGTSGQFDWFSNATLSALSELIEPLLDKHMKLAVLQDKPARLEPLLFPPGRCLHFYRDGLGISAKQVPNTFFDEIDVSRSMIQDHLRFAYEHILQEYIRYELQNPYFSFEMANASDLNRKTLKLQEESSMFSLVDEGSDTKEE